MTHRLWARRIASLACGVLLLSLGTWAQAQQPEIRRLQFQLQDGPGFVRRVQQQRDNVADRRVSDYWIGLECYPADAALRSQLGLEQQGLVVEHVVPDSPGDKAGLKQHDVLVKAGDQALANVSDLVDAIDAAKEKELSVEVLRGGKPKSIEVTPARRPEQQDMVRRVPERDLGELRRWIETLRPGEQPDGPVRYRVFGPGAVLPPAAGQKLPKDMTISVTRTGSEPAEIVVKKGGQEWRVTEEKLDELPEEIRPHVERMLGRNVAFFPPRPGFFEPGVPPGIRDDRGQQGDSKDEHRFDSRMDRQMKEMNEQLQRLRQQFDELRHSLPDRQRQPKGDRT
jgi:hypothetical protein